MLSINAKCFTAKFSKVRQIVFAAIFCDYSSIKEEISKTNLISMNWNFIQFINSMSISANIKFISLHIFYQLWYVSVIELYQISFQFRWRISFVFPFVCELAHMTIDKWCEINCMPILNQLFEKKVSNWIESYFVGCFVRLNIVSFYGFTIGYVSI